MLTLPSHAAHFLALGWFLACWIGYSYYAEWRGRDTACLASVLHLYRQDWMRRLLLRENRPGEAAEPLLVCVAENSDYLPAYRLLYRSGLNVTQALERITADCRLTQHIEDLMAFIRRSDRGIVR